MSHRYKGDVSIEECWSAVNNDAGAFLIDVRTEAEWSYVGVPALPSAPRQPLFFEWQRYPSMAVDPSFAERVATDVLQAGGTRQSKLFFLCRSGARSMASAEALTAAGFENCFNVLGGFEGPPDSEGHRGTIDGWKADGMPWMQR